MNGLFDFLKTPEGQGLFGAIAGYAANAGRGGPVNSIGRGLLSGMGAYGSAQGMQAERARQQAQAELVQAQVAAQKRKTAAIDQAFGPGGISAPQVSPGAFQPSPSQAGPMGPVMPQSMQGLSQPGSRLASMNFDQLMALKMAGVDLVDLHKYANDPLKMEQGATYQNRVTGKREYMPKVGEGIAQNDGGFYAPLPGYTQSVAQMEGAKTAANEAAKAGFDLVPVIGPGGAQYYVKRSTIVGSAQPPQASQARPQISPEEQRGRDAEAIRIVQSELQNPGLSPADKAGLERELARLQGAQTQPGFPTPSVGGFQATPTAAQAAAAAAEMERAKTAGKAAGERDAGKAQRSDKASDMLSQIDRARNLLQMDPTASGMGSLADKGMSFLGMTTSGAQTASALENISGWLTANVPRMEGPQSNFDVENYKMMAGRVGDRTLPVAERVAALNEVEAIQKRYAHLNSGGSSQGAQQPQQGQRATLRYNAQTGKLEAIR
jgi:hypothetical protein